jgi:chromosome segregation ATPase
MNSANIKKEYQKVKYLLKLAKLNADVPEYRKLKEKLDELRILYQLVTKNYAELSEKCNYTPEQYKKLMKKYEHLEKEKFDMDKLYRDSLKEYKEIIRR